MDTITASDVLLQINDLLSNYTDGSIDDSARLRALNRGVEYVQRKLTLPSDKRIQSLLYSQDQNYYTMNSDFNEPLLVTYANTNYNNGRHQWRFRPDVELIPILGQWGRGRYFAPTTVNQLKQMILAGANITQGSILITFDSITNGGILGENDATSLYIDTNVYKQGSGSLGFSINPTLGFGKGSIYVPTNWNVFQSFNQFGYYKAWAYLPTTALSSINLVLATDATNYYVFTATVTDSGTPLVANAWNLVSWTWSNNPTVVGSPNTNDITFARFDLVEGTGFGSSTVSGFRIDDFYSTYPDELNLVYLSSYKATDTTGATLKVMVDTDTDIMLFGNYVPDLIGPIALRAAYILMPQARGDKDFMAMYKQDCEDVLKLWGQTYPRQRTVNMGKTFLQRS